MICRSIFILTTWGTYRLANRFRLNVWTRVTVVYDPKSAYGDHSGNLVYKDTTMYALPYFDDRQHEEGSGQMVLGRAYTTHDGEYANVFIDDLEMWNRKLTHEEIVRVKLKLNGWTES